MTKPKKSDLFLLAGILLICIILYAGYCLLFHDKGAYVDIIINNKVVKTLPLNKDITYTINTDDNQKNVLQIKNGTAFIRDANCPDKLCVHQKAISKEGETLVCLPHKVIVKIRTDESTSFDSIT